MNKKTIKMQFREIPFYYLNQFAKRTKFKYIEKFYLHFVLQSFRFECDSHNGYQVFSIVKGKTPKETNNSSSFNNHIIYITDGDIEYIYDNDLFNSAKKTLCDYVTKNANWINPDYKFLLEKEINKINLNKKKGKNNNE